LFVKGKINCHGGTEKDDSQTFPVYIHLTLALSRERVTVEEVHLDDYSHHRIELENRMPK
jgi:hypothetical protein